jgi:hypothetical protein
LRWSFSWQFSSVWFLLRDCGEVSVEKRSVFHMVTISLLPVVAGGWADLGTGSDWSEKSRPHWSSNPGPSSWNLVVIPEAMMYMLTHIYIYIYIYNRFFCSFCKYCVLRCLYFYVSDRAADDLSVFGRNRLQIFVRVIQL